MALSPITTFFLRKYTTLEDITVGEYTLSFYRDDVSTCSFDSIQRHEVRGLGWRGLPDIVPTKCMLDFASL